jgi:hypothetical protein
MFKYITKDEGITFENESQGLSHESIVGTLMTTFEFIV